MRFRKRNTAWLAALTALIVVALVSGFATPAAMIALIALLGVALISITLVPALIPTFIRVRLRREEENWIVNSFIQTICKMIIFKAYASAGGIGEIAESLVVPEVPAR